MFFPLKRTLMLLVSSLSFIQGAKFPIVRVPRTKASLSGYAASENAVAIQNSQEYAYLVDVVVGGQSFPVIMDTGSSDLWIVSSACTTGDCEGVAKYAKENSTSFSSTSTPFKLSYLLGAVSGSVATETVSLGSFEVAPQVFALAEQTTGLGLSSTGNSGILGLCFPSVASIRTTSGNTFLDNILSHFPDEKRFFAVKLGRTPGANDPSSSFTIGEFDDTILTSNRTMQYTDVSRAGATSYNYWKAPLLGITINGTTKFELSPSLVPGVKKGHQIAVMDTGTTLILGPSVDVDAFYGAVGEGFATRKNPLTGSWEIRCEKAVLLGFVIGDEEEGTVGEYLVHPGDVSWIEGGSSEGWCMGGIQGNNEVNSGDWLMGDVFLRNVYISHHVPTPSQPIPRIGILNLIDATTSLAEFRAERGPDTTPLDVQVRTATISKNTGMNPLSPVAMYSAMSVCGFMAGLVVVCVCKIGRKDKARKGGRQQKWWALDSKHPL